MKGRVLTMAAAAMLLAVAAAGLALSSSATARGGDCFADLCVWADDNYAGKQLNIRGRGLSNKLAKRMNNQASSVKNMTGHRVLLFDKRNANGDVRCLSAGDEVPTLEAVGFQDMASSSKTTGGETCIIDDPHRRGPLCPDRALCVWEHNNQAGQRVVIRRKGLSDKLARKMDNAASSAINNRGKLAYLYSNKKGGGDVYCLEPGMEANDLGGFNDLASSSRNTGRSTCPV